MLVTQTRDNTKIIFECERSLNAAFADAAKRKGLNKSTLLRLLMIEYLESLEILEK